MNPLSLFLIALLLAGGEVFASECDFFTNCREEKSFYMYACVQTYYACKSAEYLEKISSFECPKKRGFITGSVSGNSAVMDFLNRKK